MEMTFNRVDKGFRKGVKISGDYPYWILRYRRFEFIIDEIWFPRTGFFKCKLKRVPSKFGPYWNWPSDLYDTDLYNTGEETVNYWNNKDREECFRDIVNFSCDVVDKSIEEEA